MNLKALRETQIGIYGAAGAILCFLSPLPTRSSWLLASLFFVFSGRNISRLKDILCGALVFAYLVFSVASGTGLGAFFSTTPHDRYSELAKSFEGGKLSVDLPLSPKLATMPNPYDPSKRSFADVSWDSSFYKGKYYLYWGFAPVISFILPVHFVSKYFPLDHLTGLWFAVLSVLFGTLFSLSLIRKLQGAPESGRQRYFSFFVFAFCIPFAGLLRRPEIYEVAFLSGSAYVLLSLFLFYNSRCVWASGIALGLAIASRPTLVFSTLIFAAFFWVDPKKQNWRFARQFLAGFLPVLAMILIYNQLRFSNPLEFGIHYQLNHLDMLHWGFNFKDSLFALSGFCLQWPSFNVNFPFVDLHPFGEGWLTYRHRYMNDGIVGLIWAIPFVTFLYWQRETIWKKNSGKVLFVMIFVGFALMGVSSIAGLGYRYQLENLLFFALPALVWVAYRFEAKAKFIEKLIILTTLLFSVQLGFFSSLTIELGAFNKAHPELLSPLKSFFKVPVGETGLNPGRVMYLILSDACYAPAQYRWQDDFPDASIR